MSNSDDDAELSLDAVFIEAPRPPSPEPTYAVYNRDLRLVDGGESQSHNSVKNRKWSELTIRLVGSHPLWGHHLWNASRAFASYLDARTDLYVGRDVLELGAGGGLPGIVCAKNGARKTVLTDYPDIALIDNLAANVDANVLEDERTRVAVEGFIWGHPVSPLLRLSTPSASDNHADAPAFDLIILSDLIFNHSQHEALLKTCEAVLRASSGSVLDASHTTRPSPSALVFYTHHRPHLAARDMEFFSLARARGWHCEEILTQKFPPMFPEDPGEEAVRATVHGGA